MRYHSSLAFLFVFVLSISLIGVASEEVSGEMTASSSRENLVSNGDFSEGFEAWSKFHSSNVNDQWNLSIDGPDNQLNWTRRRSRNDGGSVGVVQTMDIDATGFEKLTLSLDVKVKEHTLLNAGWWSETRGGSGEYPVKVILFYKDSRGQQHMWTHGFISTLKKQPVVYTDPKTGQEEFHDEETTLSNLTIVPRNEWYHYEVDLMDKGQLIDMDLARRGQRMPQLHKLTMIRVVGQGWDFAAAVDNISLKGTLASKTTETGSAPK